MGFSEMLLISLLAFLLFGPKKTSELARQLGQHVAHFKRAAADLQSQVSQSLDLPPDALNSVSVDGLRQTIIGALTPELMVPTIDAATGARATASSTGLVLPPEAVGSESVDHLRQTIVGELAPGLSVPQVDATATAQEQASVLPSVAPPAMSESSYA